MDSSQNGYPANFDIDYPAKMDRLTTFFRLIWSVPVIILLDILTGAESWAYVNDAGRGFSLQVSGIVAGLFVATGLMILVRQRYPCWWYDFALELNRFSSRVGAYLFLLTDKYPSTEDEQGIHIDLVYPDAKKDLNRWLPLVKWLMALPHYIILGFLMVAALFVTIIAWFAILFTGRYPRGLFNFVVGTSRWGWRVTAYAFLLTTDKYPPFSLK